MKKIHSTPFDSDNLFEYVKVNSEKINDVILLINSFENLFSSNEYPSVKNLLEIRIKSRLKNIFENIVRRNTKGYNFYEFTYVKDYPEEFISDNEIDFLQKKGYSIKVVIDKEYYCKISWPS